MNLDVFKVEVMDPDAEFNLLTTIYQSVVYDMKQTYPGWEQLSQRAQKLGAHLKATAQCLNGFVEAMQSVSDHANNLKGSTRDVGACITRVCIKQRSIENRMRSWADALTDEFALGLQQRGTYWKNRCNELDKMAAKHVKKVRARKQRPDITVMNEQRELCTKILTEQRTQFAFFINTLMPVLNNQMNMLDDGAHLRQVVDSLESTVKHVDTDQLVNSIVNDVAQGPDTAWKQCLSQAGQKWRTGSSSDDNYSVRDMCATPASLRGVGGSTMDSSASSVITSSSTRFSMKPPLQRRNSEKSIGQFSMSSPTEGSNTCLNMIGNGLTTNSSSNTITDIYRSNPPPAYQQVINARQGAIQRPQNLNFDTFTPSSCLGTTPIVYSTTSSNNGISPPGNNIIPSSGSSVASTSALLISEACKDIDQLGSDLENYCNLNNSQEKYYIDSTSVNRRASHAGDFGGGQNVHAIDQAKRVSVHTIGLGSSQQQQSQIVGGVRMRTTSASRPPPPARRSSQITAATPTAPSVAEQRMNGSMAGSRQSLDSAGLYDNNPQNQQQYYSFSRQNPAKTAAAAKFRI
ncbi:unnamed protein product [Caenorhabditis angaria]|uniref:IMD domain-containing protein n=1 Tax=Caenorhabditis angaria TaxID=860376 RepID=A0A9P1I7V8_9PELO|nr:unnamed protein product [Caenorhabditis angaria]